LESRLDVVASSLQQRREDEPSIRRAERWREQLRIAGKHDAIANLDEWLHAEEDLKRHLRKKYRKAVQDEMAAGGEQNDGR